MISPSSTSVAYHAALSLVVAEYFTELDPFFIADDLMPIQPVEAQQDFFWRYKKGAFLDAPDNERGFGGPYQRDNLAIEQDTYSCKARGLAATLPREHQRIYEKWFSIAGVEAKRKALQMRLIREKRVMATWFNRTTLPIATATGHDETTAWTDAAASTPITGINKAKKALTDVHGVGALGRICVAMSANSARNVSMGAQVRGELGLKYNADPTMKVAELSAADLARAFSVSKVSIGGAAYRSSGSIESPTLTACVPDNQVLVYIQAQPSQGQLAPTIGMGLTFAWSPMGGMMSVRASEDPKVNSDEIYVDEYSDEKALGGCAYLIGNTA